MSDARKDMIYRIACFGFQNSDFTAHADDLHTATSIFEMAKQSCERAVLCKLVGNDFVTIRDSSAEMKEVDALPQRTDSIENENRKE